MELNAIYQIMFEAVKAGNIEAVFAGAYEVFGLPVAASDASFNMLAPNNPPLPQGDDAWDRPLREKKVPFDVVRIFQEDGVIREVHQNPHQTIYLNWGSFTETPRLTTSILVNGSVAGYLAVYCPREQFQTWHLPALQVVADALGMLLQKQSADTDVVRRSFLRDLLAGEIRSPEELQKWLDICGLQLPGDYLLLAAAPREQHKMTSLHYAQSRINSTLLPVLTSQNDQLLLLLLYKQRTSPQTEGGPLSTLLQLIQSLDLFCGISRPFSQLTQASNYLQQAQTALALGRQQTTRQRVFSYEQFSLPAMLTTISSHLPLCSCIHPILLKLQDFDKQYHSHYLQTLRVYLMQMHNTAEICEQMHIHRNTLLYRLRRIEEICDCDLRQTSLNLELMISFCLWEGYHGEIIND